jgi:hypothetical protein
MSRSALFGASVPALYVKNRGERPAVAMIRLTMAAERVVVSLTGGCGSMSAEHAAPMRSVFEGGFRGFGGAILFGGTRMLDKTSGATVDGLPEMAPRIRAANPGCVSLGIVPRGGELRISSQGMVVAEEADAAYRTIVHPDQDVCLLLQDGVDEGAPWDAEWQERVRITQDMRTVAKWRSLLVVWNGGESTERELLAVAGLGWPIILLEGSGRTADRYAADRAFLHDYPYVTVVPAQAHALRSALIALGTIRAAKPSPGTINGE